MNPKKVYVGEEGKILLRKGIKLFSAAVKSTLGPSGKGVLVEDPKIIGGFSITKDGITVAKSIRFEDPVMDMAANMMRQASERTAKNVGDGTTTSVVLTEAILDAFDELYQPESGMSIIEVTRGIQSIKDEMLKSLDKMAVPVTTPDMIRHVATISTNNDPELGSLVAEVMEGVENAVVEMHNLPETKFDLIHGLSIDKGWSSQYFTNDERRRECVLDNPFVLISDREIQDVNSIGKLLQESFVKRPDTKTPSLLIISPVSTKALETFAYNAEKGNLKVCVVSPPSFGVDMKDRLSDLAKILGGRYFSQDLGDDFQMVTLETLGLARKVTVTESATIIEPLVTQQANIEALVADLAEQKKEADEMELERLNGRIQAVCGAYGVISVGAATPIELKEKKDRIDDAVCAVKAAKKEGVLPGGGISLMEAYSEVDHTKYPVVCVDIMAAAVNAPLRQMLENAGRTQVDKIIDEISAMRDGCGMNIKTGEKGDMIGMGVIDPLSAVKNSIDNAVSVACTILNTECVVSHIREIAEQK